MEADWCAEIGLDLPGIDVPWEGFIDLRKGTSAIQAISEATDHVALREALIMVNSKASPIFTARCDAWTISASEIDPDEFGSLAADAGYGFASYIDILLTDLGKLALFELHESWARHLTRHLQSLTLSNGRVEFVIRNASVDSRPGFGLTLYAAGCGADESSAYTAWQAVLHAAVTATMNPVPFPPGASSSIG